MAKYEIAIRSLLKNADKRLKDAMYKHGVPREIRSSRSMFVPDENYTEEEVFQEALQMMHRDGAVTLTYLTKGETKT